MLSWAIGSVDSSTDSEVFACNFRWSAEWVNTMFTIIATKVLLCRCCQIIKICKWDECYI